MKFGAITPHLKSKFSSSNASTPSPRRRGTARRDKFSTLAMHSQIVRRRAIWHPTMENSKSQGSNAPPTQRSVSPAVACPAAAKAPTRCQCNITNGFVTTHYTGRWLSLSHCSSDGRQTQNQVLRLLWDVQLLTFAPRPRRRGNANGWCCYYNTSHLLADIRRVFIPSSSSSSSSRICIAPITKKNIGATIKKTLQ